MLATAAKGILSSRHLIYVDENIKSTNAITPNTLLANKTKTSKIWIDFGKYCMATIFLA